MILRFADGEPFATGSAGYSVPASGPAARRIILQIEVAKQPTTAMIDTGSPLMICHPELADLLDFDHDEALEEREVDFRNETVGGFVHRAEVAILAEGGSPIYVNAPMLVPDPGQDFVDDFFPASILGMRQCLESIRFAIDPSNKTFYFGEHP